MQVTQTLKKAEYWVNFREECAAYIEKHLREKAVAIELIAIPTIKEELVFTPPKNKQYIPVHNADAEFIFEERASILCENANIPYEWAAVILRLNLRQKPFSMSNEQWNNIKAVLDLLCKNECDILKTIIAHNWTIAHIFGCDQKAPEMAFHNMGLAMLLKETDRLDNISDKAIMIRNSRGVITSYSRPNINTKNNQVLIYELL